MGWTLALELNHDRVITKGDESILCDAIRRGADLGIYTEFRNNEHVDVKSDDEDEHLTARGGNRTKKTKRQKNKKTKKQRTKKQTSLSRLFSISLK